MKKLTFGEVQVVIEDTQCNYCGENGKCFKTVIPQLFYHQSTSLKLRWVGYDPELKNEGGFLKPIRFYYEVKENDLAWVENHKESHMKKEEIFSYICQECAKQIANYK